MRWNFGKRSKSTGPCRRSNFGRPRNSKRQPATSASRRPCWNYRVCCSSRTRAPHRKPKRGPPTALSWWPVPFPDSFGRPGKYPQKMPARRLPRDIAPCTPPRRQHRSPACSAGPKHRLSARLRYSILPCEKAMKLILASASERRAEILRDAGLAFTQVSSAIDETPYPGEAPHDLVERLAAAKAELVAARVVGPSIVIAADTIVTLEGHIFTKPRSTDDARHMLEKLSGLTHAVVTGVALIRLPDAERLTFVESTLVHFAALSAGEISRYLATD